MFLALIVFHKQLTPFRNVRGFLLPFKNNLKFICLIKKFSLVLYP